MNIEGDCSVRKPPIIIPGKNKRARKVFILTDSKLF
jgi:hypothetical protein